MRTRTLRILSTLSLATGSAMFIVACSLLPKRQTESVQSMRANQPSPSQHIAQMNFGEEASFAVCTEPACPAVTVKTLAAAPDADQPRPIVDHNTIRTEPTVPHETQHRTTVYFATGSAALTAADKTTLYQLLPVAHQARRIVISSRTDNIGAEAANQSLALARAVTVRDYLRRHAPNLPAAIVIDAKGLCCFITSNDTPQGRQQNRHVDIVFDVSGQATP